ncbi:MAG: hypothetical protein RBS39_00890 [Phycisphaerales bacterium]|jgi:hypothetical protein|nr:hypothetical protein [Phycisphaerales bacterium]
MLRPGTAELARRWLAALLMVDPAERGAVVDAIERRIVEEYAGGSREGAREDGAREMDVAHPPVQREGYVEQTFTTYEAADPAHERRGGGRGGADRGLSDRGVGDASA